MPRTQSAKKALRQNVRRRARNLGRGKKIRSVVKQFEKLLRDGKTEEATKALSQVYKTSDKLAKVGFLSTNKVRRIKSRLAQKLGSSKKKK